MLTVKKCLQNGFQRLLKGDTAGRDEWCARAKQILDQQDRVVRGEPMMPGKPIRLVEGADGILTPTKH